MECRQYSYAMNLFHESDALRTLSSEGDVRVTNARHNQHHIPEESVASTDVGEAEKLLQTL
eukprot:3795798-Amphidinium_carterae.1